MATKLYLILLFSMFASFSSFAVSPEKIVKEKGFKKSPKEINWQSSEKLRSKWQRLDNVHFQIDFPKCYFLETVASEETNPAKAHSIEFSSKQCKDEHSDFQILNFNSLNLKKPSDVYGGNQIYRETGKINSKGVGIVTQVTSSIEGATQLGWGIYLFCGEMVLYAMVSNPAGEPTQKRLDTDNYSLSDNMREIFSTWRCKK